MITWDQGEPGDYVESLQARELAGEPLEELVREARGAQMGIASTQRLIAMALNNAKQTPYLNRSAADLAARREFVDQFIEAADAELRAKNRGAA